MRIGKLFAAMAASTLMATPVMANSASSLSVAKTVNAKAATSSKESNKLEGSNLILALVGAAAIAGIVIVASSGDDAADSN